MLTYADVCLMLHYGCFTAQAGHGLRADTFVSASFKQPFTYADVC